MNCVLMLETRLGMWKNSFSVACTRQGKLPWGGTHSGPVYWVIDIAAQRCAVLWESKHDHMQKGSPLNCSRYVKYV